MSIPSLSSFSSTSSTPQTTLPINKSLVHPQNEECCLVAHTTSSTSYEPNVIDNFDYSETYTAIFQNDSVDMDTEPSYTFDAELDDELTRKALSSQLFTQEQEESANLRQTYHSHEESLLPAQFFFYTNKHGETRIRTKGRLAENSRVEGRGTFKKKIDGRLWGSNFILPGIECQDSLHHWRQRREVPRCWDWRRAHQEFAGFTTVPSGARSKCEPVAGLSLTKRKLVSTCTVNF